MSAMCVTDAYFLDELTRMLGTVTARRWFEDQQTLLAVDSGGSEPSREHSRDLSGFGAEGSVATSADRACSETSCPLTERAVSGLAELPVRRFRLQRRESCASTGSRSSGSSTSPVRIRGQWTSSDLARAVSREGSCASSRSSASSGSPTRTRLMTSSEEVRDEPASPREGGNGSRSPEPGRKDRQDAHLRRVERLLEAGMENAGLIFTDAAHTVFDMCESVETVPFQHKVEHLEKSPGSITSPA